MHAREHANATKRSSDARCDRGDDRDRSDRSRQLSPRRGFSIGKSPLYFSRNASETVRTASCCKHLIPRCRNFPVVIRFARQLSVALHSKIPTFAPTTLSADIDRHPLVFLFRASEEISESPLPRPSPRSSRVEFPGDPYVRSYSRDMCLFRATNGETRGRSTDGSPFALRLITTSDYSIAGRRGA